MSDPDHSATTTALLMEPLRRTALFSDVKPDALEAIAQRTVRQVYRREEVIVREGDPGDRLFAVIEGRARVYITSPTGQRVNLAMLHPGDTFGELSLVDGRPRSASVQSETEPMVVFSLHRDDFFSLVHADKGLTDALLRSLTATVRRLTAQTADIAFLDVHHRTALHLLSLVGVQAPTTAGEHVLDRNDAIAELSAVLDRPPVEVDEALSFLVATAGLRIDGSRILIPDLELLTRQASR